jgi:hypothetical protein
MYEDPAFLSGRYEFEYKDQLSTKYIFVASLSLCRRNLPNITLDAIDSSDFWEN